MNEERFDANDECETSMKIEGLCQCAENKGVFTILAKLPKEALVDEDALARALGVCARTVRRMVTRDELPPPIRVAGRSMWLAGNVIAWLKDKAEQAERYARAEAERSKKNIS